MRRPDSIANVFRVRAPEVAEDGTITMPWVYEVDLTDVRCRWCAATLWWERMHVRMPTPAEMEYRWRDRIGSEYCQTARQHEPLVPARQHDGRPDLSMVPMPPASLIDVIDNPYERDRMRAGWRMGWVAARDAAQAVRSARDGRS